MNDMTIYSHFDIFGEALIKHYNALSYADKKDVALEVHSRTVYICVADHRKDLFEQFFNICKGDQYV